MLLLGSGGRWLVLFWGVLRTKLQVTQVLPPRAFHLMAAFFLAAVSLSAGPGVTLGHWSIPDETWAGNPWSEWLPVFPSGLESRGWSSVPWHSGAAQCQVCALCCLQPEQGVCPSW